MKITTLLSLLLIISLPAEAGKIYRYTDNNGVSTLSKSLPPYAAQKGYDVLDDTSLRLIEHVYSREELIKTQQEQTIKDQENKEQQRKELQRKEAEKQRRLDQRIRDKNLIASYPSLAVFTKSRDEDLNYRQGQINDVSESLKSNKKRLVDLQTKAAELEMSGDKISEKLTKQLSNAQKEIDNNKAVINRLNEEKRHITQQYDSDFERLKQLLGVTE